MFRAIANVFRVAELRTRLAYTLALLAVYRLGVFINTPGVDRVAINFGRPDQRALDVIDADEARRHLADGQFPAGSMGPKIEAALDFLEAGGDEVLITSPDRLAEALEGGTGTRVVAAAARAA